MSGPIGSGKTTFAKKIAAEKHAVFISIDHYVKLLGQLIGSAKDYEKYYYGVRDIIADVTLKLLKANLSVVLDFGGTQGHWDWLKSIAVAADAEIEIYNLIVPIEDRRKRVQKRNSNPATMFQFSDEEFNNMPIESMTPPEQTGLRIINIKN